MNISYLCSCYLRYDWDYIVKTMNQEKEETITVEEEVSLISMHNHEWI